MLKVKACTICITQFIILPIVFVFKISDFVKAADIIKYF